MSLGAPLRSDDFGFVFKKRWSDSTAPVAVLAAGPDSSWLVAGGAAMLRVYTIDEERMPGPAAELARLPASLRSLAVSPGGEMVAAVDHNGALHLYELESRQHLRSLPRQSTAGAVTATFTADGAYILTGGQKGEIRAFNLEGSLFARLEGAHERRRLVLVAGVPPGRELVSIGQDRRVVLWDPDVQRAVRSSELEMDVRAAAFGGGKILALGLQRLTGRRNRSLDGQPLQVDALDLVRLIDVETGTELRDLPGDDQDILAVGVTPDDRFVAAGGSAGHASIWRVEDGRRLTRIPFDSQLTSLAFAPSGSWMAAGTVEGQVSILALTSVGPRPSSAPPPSEAPKILIIIFEPEALSLSRDAGTPVRIDGRSVRIRGRVNTPTNLRRLEVAGREITSITPTDSGYLFTADVPLPRSGEHEIDLLVEDVAGHSSHKTVRVERRSRDR